MAAPKYTSMSDSEVMERQRQEAIKCFNYFFAKATIKNGGDKIKTAEILGTDVLAKNFNKKTLKFDTFSKKDIHVMIARLIKYLNIKQFRK